jgi:hypothetical protein
MAQTRFFFVAQAAVLTLTATVFISCRNVPSGTYAKDAPFLLKPCEYTSDEESGSPRKRSMAALLQALSILDWTVGAVQYDLGQVRAQACAAGQGRNECIVMIFDVAEDGTVRIYAAPETPVVSKMVGIASRWLRNIELNFRLGRCMFDAAATATIGENQPIR